MTPPPMSSTVANQLAVLLLDGSPMPGRMWTISYYSSTDLKYRQLHRWINRCEGLDFRSAGSRVVVIKPEGAQAPRHDLSRVTVGALWLAKQLDDYQQQMEGKP